MRRRCFRYFLLDPHLAQQNMSSDRGQGSDKHTGLSLNSKTSSWCTVRFAKLGGLEHTPSDAAILGMIQLDYAYDKL